VSVATSRHVALLRGINVGGSNIIKMVDLRASFESMGFTEVATLIQSGNVVFSAERADTTELTRVIEKALSRAFGYASRVVVVSAKELARVVAQAPDGFGTHPKRYRYDVLFVRKPLTTREVFEHVTLKPGVDAAHAGEHALYFRRLANKAAQSYLSKLVQRPVYQGITARNWNTTTRLLQMVSGEPRKDRPAAPR
jgi:uncharacterized protein (DUF1697 family)